MYSRRDAPPITLYIEINYFRTKALAILFDGQIKAEEVANCFTFIFIELERRNKYLISVFNNSFAFFIYPKNNFILPSGNKTYLIVA